MISVIVLLAVLPLCFVGAEPAGGYYGQKFAEPHDGFESSVNANNARRQLAVNKNAQWYGTGTGTARKDGVPGSPLGVIGVRSHGHGYGGHPQPAYHGHGDSYGHGRGDHYGNSYHHAPSYHPYSGAHGSSHGEYNIHPSHYDPHGNQHRYDGPKYGYGFNYELSKTSYH